MNHRLAAALILIMAAAMKRAVLAAIALSLLVATAGADGVTQYPLYAIPITASATGSTGSTAATLAAAAGTTTYICGFVITSGGTTTALVDNATITGTITGTLNFAYVYVSSGQGIAGVAFPQCIPASAPNTEIVVTTPAGGAGTIVAVTAWGYRL